jgi:hypothetical protein
VLIPETTAWSDYISSTCVGQGSIAANAIAAAARTGASGFDVAHALGCSGELQFAVPAVGESLTAAR